MPTLAATATTAGTAAGLPAGFLILAVALVTLSYGLSCLLWPFRTCRWCHGARKHRSPAGRTYRICRHCHATGLRLRAGRRVWNAARRLQGRAQ